jgi:hypothetical protein
MYALHEALAREHMRQLLRESERERLARSASRSRSRRHVARHARTGRSAHPARAAAEVAVQR